MSIIKQPVDKAHISIGWENGTWSCYPSKKGNDLTAAYYRFRKSQHFKCMIVWELQAGEKASNPHAKRARKLYYGNRANALAPFY
jgi:hypothetical protein